MDIALVENNDFLSFLVYEHDWIHILYIGVTAIFFLIQLCQRITLDLFIHQVTIQKLFHCQIILFCFLLKQKMKKVQVLFHH